MERSQSRLRNTEPDAPGSPEEPSIQLSHDQAPGILCNRVPAKIMYVEGKDDRHVVWSLCRRYDVPDVFDVAIPVGGGGIQRLLAVIPVALKTSQLDALGVVIDADGDVMARWQGVRSRFVSAGIGNIPANPPVDGWVSGVGSVPMVGVWIMPNNQNPGELEDFVRALIPTGDSLLPKAEMIVQNIEREGISRYPSAHRAKALIHTWLAWQRDPGQPMGQAITTATLDHASPLASRFVQWLLRLFQPTG